MLKRPIRAVDDPIGQIPGTNATSDVSNFDPVDVGQISGGMNTKTDPADIDNSQLVLAKNVIIRSDVTQRRFGTTTLAPTKPNSNKVLDFLMIQEFNGTVSQVRFDKSTLYKRLTNSWVQITGPALTGSDTDRWTLIQLNNNFFASNNGADAPIQINPVANTYVTLTSPSVVTAPKYKYWCGFYNRLVGAYLNTPGSKNPIQIGWSGDTNFGEFDPIQDISAGFNPLIEAQADYADFITGIFGLADKMIILRERTVWLALKQPVATNPFFFYTAVPNVGCDSPYTAVQTHDGIVWYDSRTKTVWRFGVNDKQPAPIGRPVEDSISITDPNLLTADWDPVNFEYTLVIPNTSFATTKLWVYSFKTNAWWTDEINNVYGINNVNFVASSFAISDLLGPISGLLDTISGLSPSVAQTAKFYNLSDGNIAQSDINVSTDSLVSYTTDIRSKVFEFGSMDAQIFQITFAIQIKVAGLLTISLSRDGGQTYPINKIVTFSSSDVGSRKFFQLTKLIKARQFSWRISSSSGVFGIMRYTFIPSPAGISRR